MVLFKGALSPPSHSSPLPLASCLRNLFVDLLITCRFSSCSLSEFSSRLQSGQISLAHQFVSLIFYSLEGFERCPSPSSLRASRFAGFSPSLHHQLADHPSLQSFAFRSSVRERMVGGCTGKIVKDSQEPKVGSKRERMVGGCARKNVKDSQELKVVSKAEQSVRILELERRVMEMTYDIADLKEKLRRKKTKRRYRRSSGFQSASSGHGTPPFQSRNVPSSSYYH